MKSNKPNKPNKNNPGFGIITPTQYLNQYATQSKFHLVLAHLVDTDDEYAQFYAEQSTKGDYIICDNGAFELGGSYAPDKLLALGTKCKADAIVLPDYPFQPASKTIEAAERMASEVRSAGFDTFFVPQSLVGDLNNWIFAYEWAAKSDLIDIIGMSILGVPNALPHIPKSYARVVMTQLLIDRGVFAFDKYHHYLGLNAGPALEIPSLIKMNAIDSCDSSGPVWAGICGQRYTKQSDSYQTSKKISKHVDFDYPMTKDSSVKDDIQYNIDLTLELFD